MKRTTHPPSHAALEVLSSYEQCLCEREGLTSASIHNYLGYLYPFIAWYETERETHVQHYFTPQGITTLALTGYWTYLQTVQRQVAAFVNRSFINLKHKFRWVLQHHLITYDPSAAVKLVEQEDVAPRHLDDQEEQALLAAVRERGILQDRVLIVLLLHTGLQAREICQLRRDQVKLGKRSGSLEIIGKRNKYREVPLNATARKVLEEYLPTLPTDSSFLFQSSKTKGTLSERALDYIIKKYASSANLPDVSPHDLRHRFGYRMAESDPLHRLAQIMGHDSLNTIRLYI